MKRVLISALFLTVALAPVRADEDTRRIQSALKEQGFFYGTVDGNPSDETAQAIRRFQIRSSLAVTGKLDDATRQAIETAGKAESPRTVDPALSIPAPEPAAPDEAAPPALPPVIKSVPARPDLRAVPSKRYENAPVPTAPNAPDGFSGVREGSAIFAGTAFASAPPFVQSSVLGKAQGLLARDGFYAGEIDGASGPRTATALREFQSAYGLTATGRLDNATLDALRIERPRFEGGQPVSRPRVRRPQPPPSRYLGGGVYEGRVVPETAPR